MDEQPLFRPEDDLDPVFGLSNPATIGTEDPFTQTGSEIRDIPHSPMTLQTNTVEVAATIVSQNGMRWICP